MLITTTESVPGKEYEIIETVFGITTQSKNMFKDIGAGFKSMVGGEVKSYTEMQEKARKDAVDRMRENAISLNADAIVMVRFDSSTIGGDMQSVIAYGTAVKFK
ncbi:heavy metal-binding domain-containing protein [Erysipelothrix aquatica]|uniref:heavy metal-binding domain-containing protein n=1 Tax=Erysipelothrix aquatica TaxID=2683714 RepID=UPI0013599415|nr:heavy metal-binding domain-containing protein [Erysipelothrix aquatica]